MQAYPQTQELSMRLPVLMFISAAIILQTGCVTGRRSLSLPVAEHAAPSAVRGQVYLASVTDDRHFENKSSDPSTPSIDGDATKMSAQEKDRMVGRQRNTYGMAMGDISLSGDDSVTKKVRLLIQEGLKRKGFTISGDPKTPISAAISVDDFWGWGTPGLFTLTFEAKIQCTVLVTDSTGVKKLVVKGYGINHGQVAKDANWQQAFDPAFEDFMTNLGAEWDGLVPSQSRASNATK